MNLATLSKVIGDTGIFIDGDWVESKDQDINGDVRLIQLADIGDGYFINKSNRFLTSEKSGELKCTILKQGDILIARMPDPLGRACIFPGLNMPCVTVVDVCIIRPDEKIANANWLKFLINSNDFRNRINKYIKGTTRQRISRGNLEKISFPRPSLEDQLHIANILSKAENLIAQRKESIRLLDEFLKSTFLDMFGDPATNSKKWELKTLKDVCLKIQDGTHFSPPITKEGRPYITAKHVRENKIDFWDNPWFISEENHRAIYKRCNPVKGDVIYIKDGATTGYAAINQYEFEFSMLSSLALLKVDKILLNSEYLVSWLNNPNAKSSILKKMAGGAIRRLTLTKINALPILVPPIELQTQFAQIVEKTEAIKTQYKQSLQELENLYGSLSQKAFSGELSINKALIV